MRFANGSATGPSSPSDPTWATELRNRLSNTALFQRQSRAEHADLVITPLSPSTPQLRPIPPPNSPIAIKDRHTSHPPRHNRTLRSLKSSRQASLSRQITVNKIKVHVTIEVITEELDNTYHSPEVRAEISTSPRRPSSKRRPRLQIRYARSPSPIPVKPCPIAHVARRSLQDEDCSICSTSLALEPVENLVWCKGACGNNFHKSCFDVWREYAARPVRCVHWYVSTKPYPFIPIKLSLQSTSWECVANAIPTAAQFGDARVSMTTTEPGARRAMQTSLQRRVTSSSVKGWTSRLKYNEPLSVCLTRGRNYLP